MEIKNAAIVGIFLSRMVYCIDDANSFLTLMVYCIDEPHGIYVLWLGTITERNEVSCRWRQYHETIFCSPLAFELL
jgi:hypothetical protein